MSKAWKGYVYKITDLDEGRIYIGLRLGQVDPTYRGSPSTKSELYQKYLQLGLFDPSIGKAEKNEIFAQYFSVEVLEENEDCSKTPTWCSDKTLTLEGAYKLIKHPECLSPIGYNLNIDKTGTFPFILDCDECSQSRSSHSIICSQKKICAECNTLDGKHKKSCSNCKSCDECGTTNQNHQRILPSGKPCSKWNPKIVELMSVAMIKHNQESPERKEKAILRGRKMGLSNTGRPKSEEWKNWRSDEFNKNNPMKNEESRAKMSATKRKQNGGQMVACQWCEVDFYRPRSSKTKFCGKICRNLESDSHKTEKRCENCEKSLGLKTAKDPQRFCSTKCFYTSSKAKAQKDDESYDKMRAAGYTDPEA